MRRPIDLYADMRAFPQHSHIDTVPLLSNELLLHIRAQLGQRVENLELQMRLDVLSSAKGIEAAVAKRKRKRFRHPSDSMRKHPLMQLSKLLDSSVATLAHLGKREAK